MISKNVIKKPLTLNMYSSNHPRKNAASYMINQNVGSSLNAPYEPNNTLSGTVKSTSEDVIVINPRIDESFNTQGITLSSIETRPRRTFASFKNYRPCLRCCSWNFIKIWFIDLFMESFKVMQKIHEFALWMISNFIIFTLRVISNVLLVYISISILNEKGENEDKKAAALMIIITGITYQIPQNMVFLYLRKKITLTSCWTDPKEAIQAIAIINTIVGIIYYVTFICLVAVSTPEYMFWLSFSIMMFQLFFDGFFNHMLCPIIFFILMIGMITVAVIYFFSYIIYYTCYKRCNVDTNQEVNRKIKYSIKDVLDQMAWKYYSNPTLSFHKDPICTVCSEQLEGKMVVGLDCNETHIFHKKCINEWLYKENACPLCKEQIIPEVIYDVI